MKTSTPTLIVVAHYKLNKDDVKTFVQIVGPHVREVEATTPGCAFYKFAADINEPSTIHLTEGWTDQKALDKHLASPSFQAIRAEALEKVRVEAYESKIYAVSGGVDLQFPD